MMSLNRKTFILYIYTVVLLLSLNFALAVDQKENGPVAQSAHPNIVGSLKVGTLKMTFISKIDGTPQPLIIKVPEGYSKEEKWPLLVTLHGLGAGPIIVPQIESMVQIGPFGRGDLWYRDLGEKDVFECVELAQEILNIDPNRIYLCGFSMGGIGTFELGLKHPDIWAACVPVCGKLDDLDLVENGNNLPFWIHSGSEDEVVSAKYSREVYKYAVDLDFDHWKYTEHEGMGHSFRINWDEVEKWLLKQKKERKPSSVHFYNDLPGRAYWVEVLTKIKEYKKIKIEAKVVGQKIQVKTKNVSDYAIHLHSMPIELSQDIIVIENGDEIFRGALAKEVIFKKSNQGTKEGKN